MSAMGQRPAIRMDGLLVPLLAYAVASVLHHVHNAVFLDAYPNMPTWLSAAGVYAAWLGVTAVGLVGYLLFRWSYHLAGLAAAAAYGAFGFDGLAHYSLAPLSAHGFMMNLTIWLEVVTATLLLVAVASLLLRRATTDRQAMGRIARQSSARRLGSRNADR